MTTPNFNSHALRAAFESTRSIIENHTLHLDQMSNDIKALESYLDEKGVRVECRYQEIKLEPCITAHLSWALDEKTRRWRILCAVNIEAGDHSSWDVRPLIETKADVRVLVYTHLPGLLQQIAGKMRIQVLEDRTKIDPVDGREYELDDACKDVKF
jgi:hypothetical protein